MRLKTAAALISLSLVCFLPRVSFADDITFTGLGSQSQNVDNEWTYPYLFTVDGPGGTSTNVPLACMNYNLDINMNESWDVTAIIVGSISPSFTTVVDGTTYTGTQIIEDAYLYNEYAPYIASNNTQEISDIQFAIWDIMDPGDGGNTGLDSGALGLVTGAQNNALSQPSSAYVNDTLLIPIEGTQTPGNGTPQMFMTNPEPPALTPEPASLVLLGTGMLGAVAILRRKQVKAVKA
jgi:hypothetical protein